MLAMRQVAAARGRGGVQLDAIRVVAKVGWVALIGLVPSDLVWTADVAVWLRRQLTMRVLR